MRGWLHRLIAIPLLLIAGHANAHKASDSFLQLKVDGDTISARWDIALRDLDFAIGLDSNNDGTITWGETRLAEAAISAYALSRLQVHGGPDLCRLISDQNLQIAEHSDGHYVVLTLRGHCPTEIRELTLDYALLFDVDAQHRGLLNLDFNGVSLPGVFAPDHRTIKADSNSTSNVFRSYFHEGLWHVWLGADHMLFLAGLFLPAVLRRKDGRWQTVDKLGTALRETAALVTAFTVAHACTLALAASGVFNPPTRIVESLVAATVLFAGLNNLLPMVHRRLWLLAGFFGLIHGAAIAGALLELGLPSNGRVWALLAFNLGVECAQLALVAVVVPLVWTFRNSAAFRNAVLVPGSIFVALAGLAWLLRRAFLLPIPMPF